MTAAAIPATVTEYAGFWRRFVAFFIDLLAVGFVVSTLLLSLASVFPNVQTLVTLDSPFAFFTLERTLDSVATDSKEADGAITTKTVKTVERTIWGKWTYRYRVSEEKSKRDDGSQSTSRTSAVWQQLDPATGQDIDTLDVSDIVWVALLVYWTVMESSRWQASFGKLAMGIKVTDALGGRLSLPRAAGRNVLKLLSALVLMIGFLMAGWTRRKQALHDMIAECYLPVRG